MTEHETHKKALLILDIQKDFTDSRARMPVDSSQAKRIIENINRLIDEAKRNGTVVIYVKNAFSRFDFIGNLFRNNAALKDSLGSDFDTRLNVVNQNIFKKSRPDAFTNRDLDMFLVNREIDEIFVTGVFADQCVLSTSKSAIRRGIKINLIQDAVGAKNDKVVLKAVEKVRKVGGIIKTAKLAFD